MLAFLTIIQKVHKSFSLQDEERAHLRPLTPEHTTQPEFCSGTEVPPRTLYRGIENKPFVSESSKRICRRTSSGSRLLSPRKASLTCRTRTSLETKAAPCDPTAHAVLSSSVLKPQLRKYCVPPPAGDTAGQQLHCKNRFLFIYRIFNSDLYTRFLWCSRPRWRGKKGL